MQEGAHDCVLGGSGDKEGREAGVGGGFIAQRLHQLQQVVQQLLILCALQHLHRMAPHLHPHIFMKPSSCRHFVVVTRSYTVAPSLPVVSTALL